MRRLRGLGDVEKAPKTVRPYDGKRRAAAEPACNIKTQQTKAAFCEPIVVEEVGDMLLAKMNGRAVGELHLKVKEGFAVVELVRTLPQTRRCGVGTRLYEAAVKWACWRDLRLASDGIRTESSECFWRKQVAKGRAKCEGGKGMKIDKHFQDHGEDWPCGIYALKKRMCFGTQPSLRGRASKATRASKSPRSRRRRR